MYKIIIEHIANKYEYEELTKIFLHPDEFKILFPNELETEQINPSDNILYINKENLGDKNMIKAQIFDQLSQIKDTKPSWGILTGVRPVKVAGDLIKQYGLDKARSLLLNEYRVSKEKEELITSTYLYQQETVGAPKDKACGVYIGIPFCPTRCLYCSFTSNQANEKKIEAYLEALHTEIDFVAKKMHDTGYYPESIYIGGGTPTTLSAEQLDILLSHICTSFDLTKLKEFTVEAGRPDTITEEKLCVIKSHGVERISINPQSMKEHTLKLIGRSHTPKMTEDAMALARKVGIQCINMDIIAGLPEETLDDFANSLSRLIEFSAENITVHTLAVKRASRLVEQDKDFHYKQARNAEQMLNYASEILYANGYRPYYLYRQKHMAGGLENIGWCKKGYEGLYNIRIMEEAQSIVALGAGGISKQYYPAENRHERIPNVSNYEIYIERLAEMLERKEINLFK